MKGRRRRRALPPDPGRDPLDLELEHHIEERTERLIAEGWERDEARTEAERRLGDRARWRAKMRAEDRIEQRRRWLVRTFDALLQDGRYALRSVGRSPGFAAALVATLALGIGATGSVFSVLDAVMLRPLPYDEPDRIVEVNLRVRGEFLIPELMADQVQPWIEGAHFLQTVGLHGRRALVRTDPGEPEQLSAVAVSPELHEVLGIDVALGRPFHSDDALPGARVAILSWTYWQRLGADPGVLGRSLELDGEPWTVVGVLPRGAKYPVAGNQDLWIPLARDRTAAGRPFGQIGVVGRLAPGSTLETAQRRADVLGEALAQSNPMRVGWSTELVPVDRWRGNPNTRRALWIVAGAVGLMLLIALFNSLNLLLVRAHTRAEEVGVRKALGASRRRIVSQIVSESVLLSLVAGVVAVALAQICVGGIRLIAPSELTFGMVYDFGLESRSLFVIFGSAVATGLTVGLAPALGLATTPTQTGAAARERSATRSAHRIRGIIVGSEIAISVVLLVGAGLLLRSFGEIVSADPGMDPDRVAFASVQLPNARYPTAADRGAFLRDVIERVRRLPGVEQVAASQGTPPDGGGITFGPAVQGEDRDVLPGEQFIPFGYVSEGFLEALGTRLVAGRAPGARDGDEGGVVVDADLARTVFGREDVVGSRFRLDADHDWLTVVGVVEELRFGGVDDRMGDGVILYPLDVDAPSSRFLSVVVRGREDAAALLPGIRQAILHVDPRLPLDRLASGRDALGAAAREPLFLVLLVSVLASIALLLAAVGVYGVLSYSVRQRRREVGIRLALGASALRIRGGLLRWSLGIGAAGTAVGLVLASILDDFIGALLYEVAPGDPWAILASAAVVLAATGAACAIPARDMTRVDPIEVLNAD